MKGARLFHLPLASIGIRVWIRDVEDVSIDHLVGALFIDNYVQGTLHTFRRARAWAMAFMAHWYANTVVKDTPRYVVSC